MEPEKIAAENACSLLTAPKNTAGAESPLRGKTLVFLGSSVTCGSAANGVSFADIIGRKHGCEIVKAAVSGTTLADTGPDSYVRRLREIKTEAADVFICQLSTNDAGRGTPLGALSQKADGTGLDLSTVAGALEYVASYAEKRWGCPVAFYTSPRYPSEAYGKMAALLEALRQKRGFTVIDLWNNGALNAATQQYRERYMADAIHPTQAGYEELWAPVFEEALIKIITGER